MALRRLPILLQIDAAPRALQLHPRSLQPLQGAREVLEHHVVQVAGYAAPLGVPDLAQALLEALALGYIPGDRYGVQRPTPGVAHQGDCELAPHRPSVFSYVPLLGGVLADLAAQQPLQALQTVCPVVGVRDVRERHA
jgi:hypothetical protein